MLSFLRSLLNQSPSVKGGGSLNAMAEEGSQRFAVWVRGLLSVSAAMPITPTEIDSAFGIYIQSRSAGSEFPEALGSDAAAWLGLWITTQFPNAQWVDHSDFGLCLAMDGSASQIVLFPDAIIEKKLELVDKFAIADFLKRLPERLEREKAKPFPRLVPPKAEIKAMQELATYHCNALRSIWKSHYGQELPLTLLGVRELDKFLRAQYLVRGIDSTLMNASGFFLGEVGRGLFGGEWKQPHAGGIAKAALHYPELDYYPVGRVWRQMTERPEGDPLDEYIRLIPSARAELRKQQLQD